MKLKIHSSILAPAKNRINSDRRISNQMIESVHDLTGEWLALLSNSNSTSDAHKPVQNILTRIKHESFTDVGKLSNDKYCVFELDNSDVKFLTNVYSSFALSTKFSAGKYTYDKLYKLMLTDVPDNTETDYVVRQLFIVLVNKALCNFIAG